ncbi:DoxX family protein [Paraburkholderia acidicola]|uniref:DoxX family protein n=1 Tax=Paraburkholderia acidicola TaxID=1912599 RepID=A0ABV1LHG8_9BURK
METNGLKVNAVGSDASLGVARVLLAILFLVSGVLKVIGFDGMVGYATIKHLPFPTLSILVALAIEIGCGSLLAVGYKVRWAALALIIFTLPTSFIFHPFWSVDAKQFDEQLYNFLKNISIIGGLLYVVVVGPGAVSLDARLKNGPK